MLKGQHIMLGRGSASTILGTVDKNTVMWALSLKGPQSRAGEIAAQLQDASSAQVMPLTLPLQRAWSVAGGRHRRVVLKEGAEGAHISATHTHRHPKTHPPSPAPFPLRGPSYISHILSSLLVLRWHFHSHHDTILACNRLIFTAYIKQIP